MAATSSLELLVGGLLAGVDPLQVGDQLGGDPAAGLAGGVAGSDLGQQRLGLGGGQVLLRPAWDQLEQQLVQLGDHPGVVLTQRPAPVDQDPQHRELLVVDDRTQPGHPGPDQGDRVGVGGVGLAALTGREDPRPGRQLRRHVDDLLAIGEQPHRDVAADAAAALDRPDPVRPLAARSSSIAASRPRRCRTGHHRGRSRRRSSPRSSPTACAGPSRSRPAAALLLHACSRCSIRCGCRAGRATLLRAEQTPLEPLPALGGTRVTQAR